jgi:hypothetical protein
MMSDPTESRLLNVERVPELIIPSNWMIGARTRMVDSWTPMPELLKLPVLRLAPGECRILVRDGITPKQQDAHDWKSRLRARLRAHLHQTIKLDRLVYDARLDPGTNLSHAIAWLGLIALAAKDVAVRTLGRRDLTVVLAGDAAQYVVDALDQLGFHVLRTWAPVLGTIIDAQSVGYHVEIRFAGRLIPSHLLALLRQSEPGPSRLYISRRSTRFVANDAEVATYLDKAGFQRVYMEDYSVIEQFRLIYTASEIVAVHGAALGPLVLRLADRPQRPLHLVELFGPGYIVSLYREICALLGGCWSAVRGKLTPEVVRDVDQRGISRAHEKSPFQIDLEGLGIALDIVRSEATGPEYEVLL